MIYNKGYDVWINLNFRGGIDIIYKGEVLPQYIGSKGRYKHPYPLVFVPDHGEACVHRLVAYSFGIMTSGKQIIDHIDNNPFNTHPFNLRVVTKSMNRALANKQERRTPERMKEWEQHWREITYTRP